MTATSDRPAFYALGREGWRGAMTLLHLPYTAWHLSYFALGAAVASHLHPDRLAWGLAAFFLGVGVAAHALDELNGHPLHTGFSDRSLAGVAIAALGGAVAIGVFGAITVTPLLVPLIVTGVFLVLAYNLELFGGRFHNSFWFAAAGGAFPAFTGYFANEQTLALKGVLIAAACFALSIAQRRLSLPARELRRRTRALNGVQELSDGTTRTLSTGGLLAPLEGALMALSLALVLSAVAMVVARL